MTNYVLVEAGVVLQSDRTGKIPNGSGWIEAPDHIAPGYRFDGHDFSLPKPSIDEVLARLTRRRWQAQTGGVEVGGVSVKTDPQTTATLTAAYIKAKENSAYVVSNWKTGQGEFVTLNAAMIVAISDAVALHIQNCFDNESVLTAAILNDPNYQNIDLDQGWPS